MKTTSLFCALFITINMFAAGSRIQSDSLGLPGDNLDLYGVLDLFKNSANPEEFERKLNSSDTKLNNLDLNGDGKIDYIRVIDRNETNMHALVLQVPINEDESQDVAVIEIEKNNDGSAHLQIVGDEELYGKNYIISPQDENSRTNVSSTASPSGLQQTTTTTTTTTTTEVAPPPPVIVNVWGWPSVQFLYAPVYIPWISPWRWSYYPSYWHPWRPIFWAAYHPFWHPYWGYYRRDYRFGVVRVHDMYYSHRVVSRTVYQRRAASPGGPVRQQVRRSPDQRSVQRTQQNQPRRSMDQRSNPGQQTQPRRSPQVQQQAQPRRNMEQRPSQAPQQHVQQRSSGMSTPRPSGPSGQSHNVSRGGGGGGGARGGRSGGGGGGGHSRR